MADTGCRLWCVTLLTYVDEIKRTLDLYQTISNKIHCDILSNSLQALFFLFQIANFKKSETMSIIENFGDESYYEIEDLE